MIARIDPNPRYSFLPIVIKTASAEGSANFDFRNDISVVSRFHFRSEPAGLIARAYLPALHASQRAVGLVSLVWLAIVKNPGESGQ